ncbi:hypothetical protein K9N68_03755 [Kovacikia minuta CCNUW1]|uniref:hypothetical protein n=1 Tax=Kovacikia minuta TaxID=2931930 RepID=UPI001CCC47BF|nr:hypothetical protein K9N68_03755 [Kovacikia minuta CCNUW1]
MNIVGPSVQEDDRTTIRRTGFGVPDTQDTGINLLQGAERRVCPRLRPIPNGWFYLARLGVGRTESVELCHRNGDRRSAQKAATLMVEFFKHFLILFTDRLRVGFAVGVEAFFASFRNGD